MRRLLSLLLFLTILLLPACISGCGDTNFLANPNITFFPADLDVGSAVSTLTRYRFVVNVSSDTGPREGIQGRLMLPLHSHLPASVAAGPIRFVDENGDAMSIDSPVSSGAEGTSITFTTDRRGDFAFVVSFPTGIDYSFDVFAIVSGVAETLTITVSTS